MQQTVLYCQLPHGRLTTGFTAFLAGACPQATPLQVSLIGVSTFL